MTQQEYGSMLRESEIRCRASGLLEQANAIRQLCDLLEAGLPPSDVVFDSGVFDRFGPPDEGEIPYLVTESPRLNHEIARPVRRAP